MKMPYAQCRGELASIEAGRLLISHPPADRGEPRAQMRNRLRHLLFLPPD